MVEQLLRELSGLPQVEAIALGGSRAGAAYDEKSDFDVYVYVTEPVPENIRREILGPYCSTMEIGNHYWEYEDNCTLQNGIDIDILWRDLDEFAAGLVRVVEEHHPSNGYTTCMWHNLKTCKILYDRDGRLNRAKEQFDCPYPRGLKRNLIRQNRNLLSGTLPAYDAQIAKALKRGDHVSVNHRVTEFLASYFDILFAVNEKTHPGEKRLVSLCRMECDILPDRFEENLDALFKAMFYAPEEIQTILGEIVEELDKIL